ncbi:MAG: cyclic nucleotide-binding domain-containing protein [Anaeromyxobacter sp.]|nr:cyclic nucleotide-binding domain-containing protein [Anaeromyxobacter sp.]MBL0275263.1 cyclic nucleotide-binding domain-containing protein [Anaeromyxobacter sp.]
MTSERSAADIYGRDFPAGAVIFEEGDPGSRLFVIQAGVVRIEKRTGGRALTLARLGPGEFFGEMALLERQPRSATAVVDEAARILELDEGAFEQVVAERSEVALRLLARLSRRLRQANRQIRDFLSADATCRAVALLRALAGPPGEDGFRPIPAELDAARLAERSGAPLDGAALVARLQRARLLRQVGERAWLAPESVVAEYMRYAELAPRFGALAAGELAEVGDLPAGRASRLEAELLHARLLPEGRVGRDASLATDYLAYLELQRRFDPEGSPP